MLFLLFHLDGERYALDAAEIAEVLPLDLRARQKLMEFPDVGARIDAVHRELNRHGWL